VPRLSTAKLELLDEDLDRGIPVLILADISKESALLNFSRNFTYYSLKTLQPLSLESKQIIDRNLDTFDIMVKWITQHCRSEAKFSVRSINDKVLKTTTDLFQIASKFSAVNDIMNILWSDWRDVTVDSEGKYCISYKSELAEQQEIANLRISVPESPYGEIEPSLLTTIRVGLQIKQKNNLLNYRISDHLFKITKERIITKMQSPWDLNGNMLFDGYSVDELHEFWLAISAFSFLHGLACLDALSKNSAPINSFVPINKKNEWVTKITHWTGLPRKKINTIFDHLTLNSELMLKAGKKINPSYQPFIKLGEFVILNTSIVMISNAERNCWDLLSVRNSTVFDRLSSLKEAHFIDDLSARFQTLGYEVLRIKVDTGDVDLLVLDWNDNFMLALQTKCQMAADRIKPHQVNEVKKGQIQISNGVNWMKQNLEIVSQKLNLKIKQLEKFRLEPLVLTKNNMFLGYLPNETPILNEPLLFWIINAPHKRSLKTAWEVAKAQSYLPKKGVHFNSRQTSLEFASKKFSIVSLPPTTTEWTPEHDIDFDFLKENDF